jgi:hypothetical protein
VKSRSFVTFTRFCAGIHRDCKSNPADFSQSRGKTRPAAAKGGEIPASPGFGRASLARRARNVKISHLLISNNAPKNSAVQILPPAFFPAAKPLNL